MDEREKLDAPSGDVERVAKAICDTLRAESGFIEDTLDLNPEFWTDVAEAALSAMPLQAGINEGLEMAAKVADTIMRGEVTGLKLDSSYRAGIRWAGERIKDAIRALASDEVKA